MVARLIAEKREKEEINASFRVFKDMNEKQINDVKKQLKGKLSSIKEMSLRVAQLEKENDRLKDGLI
jgi:cell shape-determining protein MreC